MAIHVSILDDNASYEEEEKHATESGLKPFQVSNTGGLPRLYIERIQWVMEDGEKRRKRVRIATVDLATGEVALTNAADAVPDAEEPYIGVFNRP